MATEIGRLVGVYEADTRAFDAGAKRVQSQMQATGSSVEAAINRVKAGTSTFAREIQTAGDRVGRLRERLREIRTETDIGFRTERIKEFNRLLAEATRNQRALKDAAKSHAVEVKAQLKALESGSNDAVAALSTLSPTLGGIVSAAGPLAAVAAAVVAVGASAVGIYKLVSATAEATGHLYDLSQQTGFSVETLSALGNAAETSGGNLETVAGALGIFQRHMEEANEGNEEASRLFKALNIDINDNEKALRDAFNILSKLPAGAQQTALSMKLFGRSGREVMGIFKETNGDIDKFMERLREAGTLITTSGSRKGDELSDSMTRLHQKIDATSRQIADQFAPIVADALGEFSRWLRDNQGELVSTAREVARLLGDIKDLSNFIYNISPVKLVVEISRVITTTFGEDSSGRKTEPNFGGTSIFGDWWDAFKRGPRPTGSGGALVPVDMSRVQPQTAAQIAATAKANEEKRKQEEAQWKKLQDALGSLGRGRGGGGGGGRRPSAKPERDEFAALLEREQRALASLTATTNVQRVALELLDDRYAKLNATQRNQILTIARQRDMEQQRIELQNQIRRFYDDQNKSIRELSENLRSNLGQTDAQIKEWERMGAVIPPAIKWWARFNATVLDAADATKKFKGIAESIELRDLTLGEADLARLAGKVAESVDAVGLPPVDRKARFAEIKQEMQGLAADLTYTIDRAITDGMEGGIKKGLASLALGFLDIIRNVFLQNLQNALAEALAGISVNGGGGGFLSAIRKTIFGSVGSKQGGIVKTSATDAGGKVTPRDIDNQTRELNSATTQQTQTLSHDIQLTGQSIVQGLTPAQQGFWSGLLQAAIGGAISGAASAATSGLLNRGGGGSSGGGGTPSTSSTVTPGADPNATRPRRVTPRATGGSIWPHEPYLVHKDEVIVPTAPGYVIPKGKVGGDTYITNNFTLPPMAKGSYQPKRSAREQADLVAGMIEARLR